MYQLSPRLPIAILLTVSLPAYAQSPLDSLPDGPGRELVEAACVACHETDVIWSSTGYTHDQWSDEICANNALTDVIGPQPPLAPFLQ